jgi:hypothetical protein
MTTDESKLEILKKVEEGTLTVEEGADLLSILDRGINPNQSSPEILPSHSPSDNTPEQPPTVSGCWKAGWSMILLAGAVLMALSAFWMVQGYQKAGLSWGFWLSWFPFLIGIAIMTFGWILMDSPWLHIRVNSADLGKKRKFVVSIPLPLGLVTWAFRTFPNQIPQDIKDKGVEAMLDELQQSLSRGEPFTVDVDDKEDGDQVFIYISK